MIEREDDCGLSAEQVARKRVSFDWLTSDREALHWVSDTPAAGRSIQRSWYPASGRRVDSGLESASVGSGLHAYGGSPYAVGPGLSRWLVSSVDGQIWTESKQRLTESDHVYGDLVCAGGQLFGVRENGHGDDLVVIASIAQDTTRSQSLVRVLRTTSGFLASPRLQAGRLAWLEWSHEVMPWDSSEVWCADYNRRSGLGGRSLLAGGPDESAVQPQWGPDGALYFLSDRSGWWNLYRWQAGVTAAVAPLAAECAAAPWESGYCTYAFLPRGRIAIVIQEGPRQRLVVVEPGGTITSITVPYTFIKPYLAALGNRLAVIGSSATCSQQIAVVATDGSDVVDVVTPHTRGPHAEDAAISSPACGLSVPEVMRISAQGGPLTVLFYPPSGRRTDGAAPLIVHAHAGPTYNSQLRLDWQVQFFTSRGFAVAEVDYRGSTGYGRAFRQALEGRWGTLDVQDCRDVALHLLAQGRALPGAVFISGASAGGYTALRAVCQDGPFALAVARSAIVDPRRWIRTAPRFQRPHAKILSHQDAGVEATDVRRPVLLIHGDQDAVAPFGDVAALAVALQQRRMLVGLLRLDGVDHYLSAPAGLAAALQAELAAYHAVVNAGGR